MNPNSLGGRPIFQHDMHRKDWRLIENTNETQLFLPNRLDLVTILEEGEDFIDAGELVERAKKLNANLGQSQAEFLLEHQQEIPMAWSHFPSPAFLEHLREMPEELYYLAFPGTLWNRNGYCGFPVLAKKFGWPWAFEFWWFGDSVSRNFRLLRPHG